MEDNFFEDIEPYNRHRSQTWSGQIRPYRFDCSKLPPIKTNFDDNFIAKNGEKTFLDLDMDMADKPNIQTTISSGPTSNEVSSSMNWTNCNQPNSPSDDYYFFNNTAPDTPLPDDSDVSQEKPSTPFGTKKTSRRNPWGNETYSDMISQCIENSPGQKATLQQVYDYIITHYRYFRERSDPTASAGWKNSIRHNLSLHEKFTKCAKTNDNAKSSYWVINHEAIKKPYMRRRASSMDAKKALENAKKTSVFKKKANLSNQKRMSYCEVDTPDSGNTSSSHDFSLDNSQMRARSGSNVSGISQISRRSDQISLASPSTMNQSEHVYRESLSSSSITSGRPDVDMDRISEELCLEVVRRIVVGEDEGDLLVCQSDTNSMEDNQESLSILACKKKLLEQDHFEENQFYYNPGMKQDVSKSVSREDAPNSPLPLRSSGELNKMISISSSCLPLSPQDDFHGRGIGHSITASHSNISKLSPMMQHQVIVPSYWT